jgi:hypothetical protein
MSTAQASYSSVARAGGLPQIAPPARGRAAVYLLQRQDGQRFKIGWSHDPITRVQRLPEFLAEELDLRCSWTAWLPTPERARQVERSLHRGLAIYNIPVPHRLDGYTEWFAPAAHRMAIRMLRQMPVAPGASTVTAVQPFLSAPDDVPGDEEVDDQSTLVDAIQDALWSMEDLLLRICTCLPVRVVQHEGQPIIRIARMRHSGNAVPSGLRFAVLDIERYGWRHGARSGSFVNLMEYDGDDLMLWLTPLKRIRTWADGALMGPTLAMLEQLRRRELQGAAGGKP